MSTATIETADEVVDKASKSTAVSPLSPLEKVKAGLIQLATESRSFDMTTPAGEKAARVFRAKCVSLRTAVDEAYETVNGPMLKVQRDARALRDDVKAQVKALEDPIDSLIKAEESRKEVERIRKAEAEASRVAALNERIDAIKAVAVRAVGKPSAEIEQKIQLVVGMTIDDKFQELKPAAEQAKAATLATLRELHAAALIHEEEARRIAEDRAELERMRAEKAEADRVERERVAAEQRAAQARIDQQREALETREREARQRREEEDRLAAAARELADREARERREAEEQRLAAARAEIRRQQEAQEKQAREQREAQARAEREAAEAEDRRQAEIRAEQRRQEELAAIADKRVRDVAPQLLSSLRLLVAVVRAMDAEQDADRPSEEQYQAALAQADSVIALAVDAEPATQATANGTQQSKPAASQPKSAKQTRRSTKPAAT